MLVRLAVRSRLRRAQTWNDPRARALVERATARRAAQLADTGLADYRATAHGYLTFLAQLGEGFPDCRPRSSKPTSWRSKSTGARPTRASS